MSHSYLDILTLTMDVNQICWMTAAWPSAHRSLEINIDSSPKKTLKMHWQVVSHLFGGEGFWWTRFRKQVWAHLCRLEGSKSPTGTQFTSSGPLFSWRKVHITAPGGSASLVCRLSSTRETSTHSWVAHSAGPSPAQTIFTRRYQWGLNSGSVIGRHG